MQHSTDPISKSLYLISERQIYLFFHFVSMSAFMSFHRKGAGVKSAPAPTAVVTAATPSVSVAASSSITFHRKGAGVNLSVVPYVAAPPAAPSPAPVAAAPPMAEPSISMTQWILQILFWRQLNVRSGFAHMCGGIGFIPTEELLSAFHIPKNREMMFVCDATSESYAKVINFRGVIRTPDQMYVITKNELFDLACGKLIPTKSLVDFLKQDKNLVLPTLIGALSIPDYYALIKRAVLDIKETGTATFRHPCVDMLWSLDGTTYKVFASVFESPDFLVNDALSLDRHYNDCVHALFRATEEKLQQAAIRRALPPGHGGKTLRIGC